MKSNNRNAYIISGALFWIAAAVNALSQVQMIVPMLLILAGVFMFLAAWQEHRKRGPVRCDAGEDRRSFNPFKTGLVMFFAIAVAGVLGYWVGYGLGQIF